MTQTKVHPSVALRRAWSKFGDSAGLAPGPDANSTSLAETVALILSCGISNNPSAEEPAETEKKPQNISILCRICKGNHFTTKCPFKDTYQPLDVVQSSLESAKESVSAPEGGATGARYVPPSARNRGGPGGEGMTMAGGAMPPSRRDEFPTIRITNLSEDTQEADVRTLVRKFGTPNRVV